MATIYSLVCENGSSGSYWAGLSTDGKARYGAAGSERVFAHIRDFATYVIANATRANYEVCEIGDAFVDECNPIQLQSVATAGILITPTVSGLITSAFHGGVFGGGYVYRCKDSSDGGSGVAVIRLPSFSRIEGLDLYVEDGGHNRGGIDGIKGGVIDKCIIRKDGDCTASTSDYGINSSSGGVTVSNSIITNFGRGVYLPRYTGTDRFLNLTIVKNNQGLDLQYDSTTVLTSFAGVVSAGNVSDNWGALQPNCEFAFNNAGEAGDTIWDTESVSTAVVIDPSTDFEDFTNNDFRPSSTSPLIGAGIVLYGQPPYDLSGDARPNYNPSGEESSDIGAFEYDHGYGLAPKTVTLEITNIVSGSELAIYKASDNSVIVAPQTVPGTNYSTSYTYTADTLVNIVLRNASGVTKYQPYKTQGNITENGLSVYVSQIEDIIAQ